VSDQLAARLRTVWPLLLGHAAAWLAALILRHTGLQLDSALVLEALSFAASWAIWEAGTWLEKRPNPVAQVVGRWLVSAGQVIGPPTYPEQPPSQP